MADFLKRDLHTHTCFSDGANTPEEMIQAAIDLGMSEIGISDHSYLSFDCDYTLQADRLDDYKTEILRLKEKYKDKIEVRLGIEQDYFSDFPAEGYEYVIGSVHYVKADGVCYAVDNTPEIMEEAAAAFGGDYYALAESYFETVADVVNKTNCDIIGHFDLLSKFNEHYHLFDESDPRYIKAWQKAADRLIETGKPFEINTGAISRGYRTDAYPSKAMRAYIKARGGKFILSSDSHRKDTLMYAFAIFSDY